jgi:hypothetical protein
VMATGEHHAWETKFKGIIIILKTEVLVFSLITDPEGAERGA